MNISEYGTSVREGVEHGAYPLSSSPRAAKNINCIFTSSFKSLELAVDVEKMEKVIYNLLSNALKYSPDNAQVILSIDQRLLQEKSYSKKYYVGNKFFGEIWIGHF